MQSEFMLQIIKILEKEIKLFITSTVMSESVTDKSDPCVLTPALRRRYFRDSENPYEDPVCPPLLM